MMRTRSTLQPRPALSGGAVPAKAGLSDGPAEPERLSRGDAAGFDVIDRFILAVRRAENVVVAETRGLQHGDSVDLDGFSHRKSECLLELHRAIAELKVSHDIATIDRHLRGLRAALEENAVLLKTHIDAAEEVSDIIARVIREDLSDGTYQHCGRAAAR